MFKIDTRPCDNCGEPRNRPDNHCVKYCIDCAMGMNKLHYEVHMTKKKAA